MTALSKSLQIYNPSISNPSITNVCQFQMFVNCLLKVGYAIYPIFFVSGESIYYYAATLFNIM